MSRPRSSRFLSGSSMALRARAGPIACLPRLLHSGRTRRSRRRFAFGMIVTLAASLAAGGPTFAGLIISASPSSFGRQTGRRSLEAYATACLGLLELGLDAPGIAAEHLERTQADRMPASTEAARFRAIVQIGRACGLTVVHVAKLRQDRSYLPLGVRAEHFKPTAGV